MSYLHYTTECHEHHDVVRDYGALAPRIVCLCGSTSFRDEFARQNFRLTLAGFIVLSIGCDTKSGEGLLLTDADKITLDALHKRKIDLADVVFIINVGGYIGASTRSEIAYAKSLGKTIEWLEDAHR